MASDTDFEELLSAATGEAVAVRRPPTTMMQRMLWALAALPVVSLLLLLSMALRVRLADGAWPVRNMPDPKTLGIHNTVTIIALLGSFVAVILVPLLTLAVFFLGQKRTSNRPVLLAIVGFVVLFLVLRLDLGGLGDWFAD
jgi:hypothetical protein